MNITKPISEIMSTHLVTVVPEAPLQRIINVFKENSFHHLPVVESGQKIVGIISKDDLRRYAEASSENTLSQAEKQTVTAKNIMTKTPLCLDTDDSIGLAADIFLANQFHALPVVDDNQLVGIVTTHDLLTYSFRSVSALTTNL